MTLNLREKISATDRLLDDLGLPLSTPVLEWHTYRDAIPNVAAVVTFQQHATDDHGSPLVLTPNNSTTEPGSLFVITAQCALGGTVDDLDDPRVTGSYTHVSNMRVFWGRLESTEVTDWDDPFTVTAAGYSTNWASAGMAVYAPGITVGRTSAASGDYHVVAAQIANVYGVVLVAQRQDGTTAAAGVDQISGTPYTWRGLTITNKDHGVIFDWTNGGALGTNPASTFGPTSGSSGGTGETYLLTLELIDDPDYADPLDTPAGWYVDDDRTGALVSHRSGTGRAKPLEATQPLWAEVTLSRALLEGDLPTVGESFRITLNADVADALGMAAAEAPRFTGQITDFDLVERGDTSYLQVNATGRSARLSRVPLTVDRPQELDGERARRILRKASLTVPLDIGTIDPGTVEVVAEEYVGRSAGSALDQLRVDSLGQLVEHRSGRLDWHDAEHRRDLVSLVTLAGDQHLIMPFRWSQSIADLVNDAEVTYGTGGDEVARVVDAPSVEDWGPYPVQLSTRLATTADAHSLASLIVGRYGDPAYTLPALTVDIVRTAGATAGAVLSLNHGDKITADGLPTGGPFTAGDLFVEGTAEEWLQDRIRVSLNAADPAIAGVGLRYLDVPPWLQYADVIPTISYLDAGALLDGTDLGTPYVEWDAGAPADVPDYLLDAGDPDDVPDYRFDGGTP